MPPLSLPPAPHPATLRAMWAHFEYRRGAQLAALLCREARRGHSAVLDSFAEHPLADDWRDFAVASVKAYLSARRGRVYVVTNPVHGGLYKIGQTRDGLQARLRTLNSAGVVGYFVEVHSVVVADRFHVERAAQRALALTSMRHKEFFQCDYGTATLALETAASQDAAALAPLST